MILTSYQHFTAKSNADEGQTQQGLIVRRLGLQEYEPIWKSMRYLVEQASAARGDEIWLLSHKPVFTQGLAGKAKHILNPAEIPVVQIDRGGQVTYHGPGQLVVYLLLNVGRRNMNVRDLVDLIEQAIIKTLGEFGIAASNKAKAPGVYVNDAKIAALGLRIRKGWSYHGMSLNVQMDLEPFSRINPCGYENLAVTQIADHVPASDTLMQKVSKVLSNKLLSELGYFEYYESD
ncbi:MAG: lipoyl(octanoyl) transferase LipB [Proteobacteria bacterium]|nr:lipoyl(octanoyl) transferase LipB [Pseudomonadota bacterium]MDA1292051.1 lipoyl(octanoyl) transferase LipB [Pseudomonadota bacterium]